MVAQKNSLVANINRKKKTGTSRPKSKSTVSRAAYDEMQRGWPKGASKTTTSKKTAAKGGAKRKKTIETARLR